MTQHKTLSYCRDLCRECPALVTKPYHRAHVGEGRRGAARKLYAWLGGLQGRLRGLWPGVLAGEYPDLGPHQPGQRHPVRVIHRHGGLVGEQALRQIPLLQVRRERERMGGGGRQWERVGRETATHNVHSNFRKLRWKIWECDVFIKN